MKFAEKCPKCGGEVQTKNLKKSIGLGVVDIPVAQFCLNPVCNWYQDFSETTKPDDIKEDVVQIKLPRIKNKMPSIKGISELINNRPGLKKLQLQISELIKQNMLVVRGVVVVVVLSLLLIWILHLLQPQSAMLQEPAANSPVKSTPQAALTIPATTTTIPAIQEHKTYTIKMDVGHGFNPAFVSINTSDIVVWNNWESQRTRIYLMSKEGLFKNQLMQDTSRFSYQFNKSGKYTFALAEFGSLNEYPNAIGIVIVK